MDYTRYKNLVADTEMRSSIASEQAPTENS